MAKFPLYRQNVHGYCIFVGEDHYSATAMYLSYLMI